MTTSERAALCREVCEFLGIPPMILERSPGPVCPYPDILTGDGMLLVMDALTEKWYDILFSRSGYEHEVVIEANNSVTRAIIESASKPLALALAVRELARRSKG